MKKGFKGYEFKNYKSFREILERNISEKGDKPGFLYREKGDVKTVMYSEFLTECSSLGNALYDMGLSGRHVACISDNCYKMIVVFFTMLHSQGVYVPIDRQLPEKDIVNVLNHSDSEVIFFSKKYKKKIMENKDNLTGIKYFFCLDDEPTDEYGSYDELISKGRELKANGYSSYEENTGDTKALRV